MRKIAALIIIAVIMLYAVKTNAKSLYSWKPRLTAGGSLSVISPGGDDKDWFETSMGWGFSAHYWLKPHTQIAVHGWYSSVQVREDEYYDNLGITEAFDVWEVEGKVLHGSIELRKLYSASPKNFLYFGVGADIFWFDTIEGRYEIYTEGQPDIGVISDERSPSLTGGMHVAPGMMFLFKSFMGQMFIDVGVRLHYIMDGDTDNPLWVNPHFTTGLRIF